MKLVIEDESGTRSVVPFASDEITVGRAAEGVTFRLGDRDVSRRHARFVRANGSVSVEDLGSLTGTLVNGERIAGRRRLREGDLVEIGDYDLAVLPDVSAEAVPGAPPPLPAALRALAGERAVTRELPVARIDPAHDETAARRRTLRLAIAAGIVALAVGVAAGLAAGALAAPAVPPSPATAPAAAQDP